VDPRLTSVVPDAAAAGQLSPADEPSGSERVPLGQLLVAEGFISDTQLHQALHVGSQTGERLGEVVVRQGLASEEDIARLLAEQWDLSYVDRASIWFDADALARLSREDAQRIEAMPTRVQDGRVVVAVAEPTEQRLAALREVIGEDTVVVVVPKTALEAGLHSELLASDGRSPSKPRDDSFEPSESASEPGLAFAEDDDLLEAIALEQPEYTKNRKHDTPSPARTRTPSPARKAPPPAFAARGDAETPQETGALAQGLAQLIEAQLGAARATSEGEAERMESLERRIDQLEDELGSNRKALAELGKHLKAVAAILDNL
jgi:Type II secretion system (T2SS), protein E, N-terminal domain